ncbi:MAG: Gfo/Idh/MocA family oxidoreductase [Flavobacteriaceae bacterium]|nr:Gfo/Idh/MocA family oxidoreductase [Flavobacteriaceae bacterium]MDZ4148230.1 Gfo/Idh/MocA family oxidoreductase [Flavobacteriaceae bacterium]
MKRKEFIVKSGLLSAGVLASASAIGSISRFGANDTINIGIIGTGDRGSGLIPFLNEIDGIHVAACCDILPFRLEEGLAKTANKAKGYADYRKLLDNKDIDAVLIATPFYLHSQIGIDALDAGKHVYGEKTLAKGYAGIDALVKKAAQTSRIFQTGHQYHSSHLYVHIADLIKQGKIGKITAFQCQWNRNGNWRRSVPSPELERAVNWRMYREYSGGLVAELCSHQIDFVNWVLGEMPDKVMGVGGIDYWKDGRETYDNMHLIYSYPNGVKAGFTCLTSNALDDYKIKVMGDKGTIILDYQKAWFYPEGNYAREIGNVDGVSGATKTWEQGKGIPIDIHHADPSKQALIDFRDSVRNNKTPISNVITGANTAVCVQMGLDAMYQNEIIQKPLSSFYSF